MENENFPFRGMKGQDPLENFIHTHRDAFDDLKAPPGVWKRISKKNAQVHPLWKWSAVAASALLLIAVGYIFGLQSSPEDHIAGWEEFQEAEQFYITRANYKMEEIRSLQVDTAVLQDIKVLDEIYHQLRTQLLEDPKADAQILLHHMIRHQQKKLKVMDEILHRVKKYEGSEM
jgi:hypothetical protein